MFNFFKKSRNPNRPSNLRRRLGVDRLETRATPSTVTVLADTLMIEGTSGHDMIRVEYHPYLERVFVYDNGEIVGDYAHLEFTKISFNGYAGDDKFDIDSNLNIRAILNGGEGDDVLIAGAGTRSPFDNSPRAVPESVVLLGGAGNDVLVGGDGRDLLIGGDGADVIYGNGGDDMVIGGRTFIDDNSKALAGLLGIWNSAESYVDRIENVRFYVESLIPPDLDVSFVYFDGSTDALYGGSGADWFFANDSTKIGDLNRDEIVN